MTNNRENFISEYEHLVNHVFVHPIGCSERKRYKVDDIDWIGTRDGIVDTDKFLSLLKEIDIREPNSFDQSYLGWHIVMKDGCWYEGDVDWEYGSCFWSFHEVPIRPEKRIELFEKEDIIGTMFDEDDDDDNSEEKSAKTKLYVSE